MKARWLMSLVITVAALALTGPLPAAVVISQVYGGGGNTGATFTHDFVELFNNGATAASITGWSVQYASAAGSSWAATNLSGSLQPGQHFLIQEQTGGAIGIALPTADNAGTINLSATAGKVALVSSTTPLTSDCPSGAQIVDFVGYGATASCYEGSGPAAAPSNSTAALRSDSCYDTNDNTADFNTGVPNPRNFATPAVSCPTPPPIDYGVLQFPASATIAACDAAPGTTVYGQIYIVGVTPTGSGVTGLVAQLGVGPTGTDPSAAPGWSWSTATFNSQHTGNNNDEYQQPFGSLHRSAVYDYAYRFSYLGGPFVYADLDGTTNGYAIAQAGQATVSGDVIYCDRFDR
jgi:predicted extracellular nuclease